MADTRPGKGSRDPELLCPCIRALYESLAHEAAEAGIPCVLIETLRDQERQAYYVNIGTSWTTNSKHLPQPPKGLALAFDVCPRDYLAIKGWFPSGPLWKALGSFGKASGLFWGGDWKTARDYPHFEILECRCSAAPRVEVA